MPPKRFVITSARSHHPWQWLLNYLRSLNWMDRHIILERLRYTKPHVYRLLIEALGPDEAINGQDIAPKVNDRLKAPIPLHNKPYRIFRQTKITEYFHKRRRR